MWSDRTGWFTDILTEGDEYFDPKHQMYGVFLQDHGCVHPLGTGFLTEADAELFINQTILGQGRLPE